MTTSNVVDVDPAAIVTIEVTLASVVSSETNETGKSESSVPEMLTEPASARTPSPSVADAGRETIRFVCSLSSTVMMLLPAA